MAGLVLFGVASLGCGLAHSLPALVVWRAVQGAAPALLMPASLKLALSAVAARERGTAVGVWAAVGGAAASIGPVLGSLLLTLGWRWLFFINVPPLAAALFVATTRLPHAQAEARARIDWFGTGLVLGATAPVCTALVQASTWAPARTWIVLALGGLRAAATVWHVRRHPDPIVRPRLLAVRRLRLGVAGIFAYYVGFAIQMVGATLLLTNLWHLSALQAALGIAPGPLLSSLLAPFAGRLTARFGRRAMTLGGASLFAITGAWSLLAVSPTPNYALGFLPGLLCWGVANALLQPTLFAMADRADMGSSGALPTIDCSTGG